MPDLQPYAIWLPLIAFCISCAGALWLAKDLARIGQADLPTGRSSHQQPTPRGGGLAIMGAFVLCAALLDMHSVPLAGLSLLIIVSWLDDKNSVNWRLRLLTQCFVLGLSLAALWQDGILAAMQAPVALLPLALFVGLIGIAWLWHINLFNFMDGIDGLAAAQAAVIAFGAGAYFLDKAGDAQTTLLALTLGAASLGFFVWNYPPARIFLGEVGSIPLGFLTGYFLILLASTGAWGLTLALPLWFWADASATLLRRLAHRRSPVEPHRDHYYQRAAGTSTGGHKRVLHLFLSLQILNCAALAMTVKLFPGLQWPLPLVSAGFAALYFLGLVKLAREET